jgi:hypothetical protein
MEKKKNNKKTIMEMEKKLFFVITKKKSLEKKCTIIESNRIILNLMYKVLCGLLNIIYSFNIFLSSHIETTSNL